MFKIKEIQAAERDDFQRRTFCLEPSVRLPFYLTRQKVTEMFPKEFLKLLQVAILVKRPGEGISLFFSNA